MDPTNATQPAAKRQTFRGVGLIVLGGLLFFGVGLLLWRMLPMLMHPGVQIGGTTFNGSASEGRGIALLLAAICGFGALSAAFGAWLLNRASKA
jgi:hypothetical protein